LLFSLTPSPHPHPAGNAASLAGGGVCISQREDTYPVVDATSPQGDVGASPNFEIYDTTPGVSSDVDGVYAAFILNDFLNYK